MIIIQVSTNNLALYVKFQSIFTNNWFLYHSKQDTYYNKY